MRVLVLGGTGLISTPIVDQLIKSNHDPVVFNRGETPSRSNADVETVHGDRNDFDAFEAAIAEIKPDVVIDMLTFDSRTAENAVSVFKKHPVKHYLFCSAAAVYGRLDQIPATESEPHKSKSPYGRNKSEAEHVFVQALEQDQFPVTVLRPAHAYGPGQTLPSLWGYDACLVSRIRTDKAVFVPGDGYGAFQLMYCDDIASAFVEAIGVSNTLGQIYNIAPEETVDWHTYLTTVASLLNKEANLMPVTTNLLIAGAPPEASALLEEFYQYPMAYNSDLFRSHVPSWNASTPLSVGLQRTLDWMGKVNAHMMPSEQAWIDPLVDKLLDFEKDLALSDFAFDKKVFSQD